MNKRLVCQFWSYSVLFIGIAIASSPLMGKTFLKFSGGPSGGTFQYFSNGLAVRLSRRLPNVKVSNQTSRGSVENIRKVNGKRTHFGIAYSGDLFLARKGQLAGDQKHYNNVRVIAFLYRAPAQLAVLKNSTIKTIHDLKDKKVALGGPGSGAAASAERYFKLVKLWDVIDRQFLGYTKASAAMKDGHIDAMWIMAGYPTRALIELAASRKMTLLPTYAIAVANGLKEKMPFYQSLSIPANTYEGVDTPTSTFFDSALWVVHKDVSEAIVYAALADIYSKAGLQYMINIKSTAKQMTIARGITGVVTPLHPGALRFWREKGLSIPKQVAGQ